MLEFIKQIFSKSKSKLMLIDGEHYDALHHPYSGHGGDNLCGICNRDYEDEIHLSYEKWSAEMDDVFGR